MNQNLKDQDVLVEPVKDQKILAFVSIDKMTNEFVAVRADKIKFQMKSKV